MTETLTTLERRRLERAGSLHWFHWGVVGLSVALTLGAWRFSANQVQEKKQRQFDRESEQVLELVQERLQKYEDALWGGVALIDTLEREVEHAEWLRFTDSLDMETKYPGINGLGVISRVERDRKADFLAVHRGDRPDFRVHPEHGESVLYPITYIEPVVGNAQAVGLDMAHEANRLSAARKALDTGEATITGPIVLVQDEEQSPGFLQFAPFYDRDAEGDRFRGLVYAPFVVKKLMRGALDKESRHVGVRISDAGSVLYDEHLPEEPDYDPHPLHQASLDLELYGRTWNFDLRTARSFRNAQGSAQPTIILLSGLVIDSLLLGLFMLLSRTNRRAIAFADAANRELVEKAADLEQSNHELERFAYVASHDLQEPLRMVRSFAELLGSEYEGRIDDQGRKWLGFLMDGASRMQALVRDLLSYSRVGRHEYDYQSVELDSLFDEVLSDLDNVVEESKAVVTRDELPRVLADRSQLRLVLQNLLSNAIKFCRPGSAPRVHIGVRPPEGDGLRTFYVQDSGIGIQPEYADRVFVIFQRLHTQDSYSGTGLGLAIAKKIVDGLGGEVWFEETKGGGTTFFVRLPEPVEVGSLVPDARNVSEVTGATP